MLRLAIPLLMLVSAAPASAAVAERRAVLATVQAFFDALAARDQGRLMAVVVPEGRISGHAVRDGKAALWTQAWADWAKSIAAAPTSLVERMHGPKVRVRGNMASVWTNYSFYRGATFSHCGIDIFDMAKVDGRWKILNLTFTVEPEGCRRR